MCSFHTHLGNKISDNSQPIATIKIGKRESPFPVELLRESPNLTFLRRRGLSEQALSYMKPEDNSFTRNVKNLAFVQIDFW